MVETPMSVGPSKKRQRGTSTPYKVSGNYIMTEAQLATFQTFVNVTLESCTLPFTWPDKDGSGSLTARFTEPLPEWRNIGIGYYLVNTNLEILP